jgi:hypothetical protein
MGAKGPICVEVSLSSDSSLLQEEKDLAYHLFDRSNFLLHTGGLTTTHTRKTIDAPRVLVRPISAAPSAPHKSLHAALGAKAAIRKLREGNTYLSIVLSSSPARRSFSLFSKT